MAQSHCYQIFKKNLKDLYIRDYIPFSTTIFFHNLPFEFRQHSTSHVLTNIYNQKYKESS